VEYIILRCLFGAILGNFQHENNIAIAKTLEHQKTKGYQVVGP